MRRLQLYYQNTSGFTSELFKIILSTHQNNPGKIKYTRSVEITLYQSKLRY